VQDPPHFLLFIREGIIFEGFPFDILKGRGPQSSRGFGVAVVKVADCLRGICQILSGSQEFSALLVPVHLTRYWSCLFLNLESRISSTSHSSSESIMIGGGLVGRLPMISSCGAFVNKDI